MAIIELDNVGIVFPVYGANAKSLRQTLFSRATGGVAKENHGVITVTALQNITMNIEDGDRVGLVGHNGAGKSTLLRVLARVYPPSSGKITIRGRISSLFNPALGMDPDDTGMENIRTIGLFLGMSPHEIDQKIHDIGEFTELGEFLALPVRTYSSGMQLRLSFAIATAIDPEILLLDEGFGAGDARFSEKAEHRINSLIKRTKVIVLATHSAGMIRSMCNRAALMTEGRLIAYGGVEDILNQYDKMNHPS
ncbi:MAG: ABC transporter ATP-binding protein [Rhodospirillaceae bacterium]